MQPTTGIRVFLVERTKNRHKVVSFDRRHGTRGKVIGDPTSKHLAPLVRLVGLPILNVDEGFNSTGKGRNCSVALALIKRIAASNNDAPDGKGSVTSFGKSNGRVRTKAECPLATGYSDTLLPRA